MMQDQEEETKPWTRIAVPLELIREASMCRSWHRAQRREETGKLLDSQPSMRLPAKGQRSWQEMGNNAERGRVHE